MHRAPAWLALAAALLAACIPDSQGSPPARASSGPVDDERLALAHLDPGQWLMVGGGRSEQHFSGLAQIDAENVGELRPAWVAEFDTVRGQEAQPIVVDGVMYVSTAWSKVYALDAATGEELWKYDPQVPGEAGFRGCCDVVNRGVAYYKGRVYVGALDGRLVAIDAATGEADWIVDTVDQTQSYTITGAPRVVRDKVIIGNAGAEYGVRGYVTAYDADTGEQVWRFYTVPGEPGVADGEVSDEVLEEVARPTWFGDRYWRGGGGGTAWDAIVYDPELDRLYIGVGNGSPHSRVLRSDGHGDNLFLASILALDPDTGEYLWHYQETPGDSWDYTSVQPMILADLEIPSEDGGATRKVILHAPKNGFFYVVDRETGAPISAEPFVDGIRWATGVDPETWRPIEVPGAHYENAPFLGSPRVSGAHNWHPMAFSPQTGLVYIPSSEHTWLFQPARPAEEVAPAPVESPPPWRSYLQAWDPVAGERRWAVDIVGGRDDAGGGGVLATAGGLVFQGNGEIVGNFVAYDAETGGVLWRIETPNAIIAAPMSYMAGGEQYVAVAAGGGGGGAPLMGSLSPPREKQPGRLYAFKLDGTASLPEPPPLAGPATDPEESFDAVAVAAGAGLYSANCGRCHGLPGAQSNVITDLRRSLAAADAAVWRSIVIDGAYEAAGMVSFAGMLTPDQAESIRAWVGSESQGLAANQRAGVPER
jgi:quinohemoprotein ethanol dehydrogenase